jgi:UDP-glucose 4-epimerase
VNNIKIPISFEKRREGDVAECYADPAKAQKFLNWKAKKTLEEMCKSSWKPFLK